MTSVLIDSSGWIEYFTEGAHTDRFFHHLKDPRRIVTPVIVLYEVYKKMKRERSEQEALEAVAQMLKTQVVPLSEDLALSAADVSLEYGLPMADAIVYATALEYGCKVLTLDSDFSKLPNAEVLR